MHKKEEMKDFNDCLDTCDMVPKSFFKSQHFHYLCKFNYVFKHSFH